MIETHTDRDYLYREYYQKEKTQQEIADELGVSRTTISKYLSLFDIPKPDSSRETPRHKNSEPVPLYYNDYGYRMWRHYAFGERNAVFVHRLAAVAWFGWDAVCDSVVHHDNHMRIDNREENLETMTASEHTRMHQLEEVSE